MKILWRLLALTTTLCITGPILLAQSNWKVYMSEGTINCIQVQGDSLWLATEGGIVLYNLSTGATRYYTSADGIAQNKSQRALAIAGDGTVACGGIYDGISLLHPGSQRWMKYFNNNNSAFFYNAMFVEGLAFDSKGTLWIADDNGSSVTMNTFPMPENAKRLTQSHIVKVDSNDNVWFSTYKGLLCIAANGQSVTYDTLDGLNCSGGVSDIVVDGKGSVWVTNGAGAAVYNGTVWRSFTSSNSSLPQGNVNRLALDKYGNAVVMVDSSFWAFRNNTWKEFTALPNLHGGRVTCVGWDKLGNLFVAVTPQPLVQSCQVVWPSPILYRFDGNTWSKVPIKVGELPLGEATRTVIDKTGRIWVQTLGGLFMFDGVSWKRMTPEVQDTTSSTSFGALAVDSSGTIWIGGSWYSTSGSGWGAVFHESLLSFDGNRWTSWNLPSDSGGRAGVTEIFIDSKNNKWIAFGSCAYRLDGQNWIKYPNVTSLGDILAPVKFSVDSSGVIWYASGDTLFSFDGITTKAYPSGVGSSIRSKNIGVAPDGSLWVVFGNLGSSLGRFKNGMWTIYNYPGPFYSTYRAWDDARICVQSNGTVWVGADGTGLWSFDGSHWNNYTYLNSDIGCQFISDIAIDSHGNKWMVSGNWENSVMVFNENGVTAVRPELSQSSIPTGLTLSQNYPNPFNPSTTISYRLPSDSFVTLRVYDVLGREIETMVNERQSAGTHSVTFRATNLPTGVYIYTLQTGAYHDTQKMILLK